MSTPNGAVVVDDSMDSYSVMPPVEPIKEINIELPYRFKPRAYQEVMLSQVPTHYKRGCFVWHRRAGKDATAWNLMIREAVKKSAIYYYIFPSYRQGRKAIWEAVDSRTGLKFLDYIPKELIAGIHDTEMRITFVNGSILRVCGSEDINTLMGTPPYGVVYSEYSLQSPKAFDMIRPILSENGGFALFVFTPRGMRNHGFELWKMAMENPNWYAEVLTTKDTKREDGTPVVSDEAIAEEISSGMSKDLAEQEYKCAWEGFMEGAYYAKQIKSLMNDEPKHVTDVSWEPILPVHTAWDLGMDDSTTIWFFQVVGMEVRIIDYFEDSGEGLSYYVKEMDKLHYKYGTHYLPHDVEVRELGTGKSRRATLESLGLHNLVTVKRTNDIMHGIDAVRNFLPKCWFDKTKCSHGISSLANYHAEYDEDKKRLTDRPYHDHTSHAADAFRCLAESSLPTTKKNKSVTQMYADRRR